MATSPIQWSCQTNPNPFDKAETAEYTDYPEDISDAIETAYQNNVTEIVIRTGYRVNLKHKLQIHASDSHRQRPIRRRCLTDENPAISLTMSIEENQHRLAERYGFNLESDSADVDTHYQGSFFITTWFTKLFANPSTLSFDRISQILIDGIKQERVEAQRNRWKKLTDELQKVINESSTDTNKKRLQLLREKCVTLYTKHSSLYRIANQTLRDNNLAKMDTLGPFCFLIYDHIGRQSTHKRVISDHLYQILHRTEDNKLVVYRGDKVSNVKLEQYRQAAGDAKQCFKWLCFVSTSRKKDVASKFAINVFYEIDLGRFKSNDQFADIKKLSAFPKEEEILLRPGVRFRVDRVESRTDTPLTHVYIHVLPSYISTL